MTTSTTPTHEHDSAPFAHLSVAKMPAHWLMARLGKRVLRPGGLEMTRWMLDELRIGPEDDAIEFAPGLGLTAREIVARRPRTYVGVEREPEAIAQTERALAGHERARIVRADASRTPLPDACASVVVGEAMLSMHPEAKKQAIASEARRLLRPGGGYAIHELAVTDPDRQSEVERDFSDCIHVGVRIGTVPQWKTWLERAGFEVASVTTAPMRLLETMRLIQDEGVWRTARFVFNSLRVPGAASRLLDVRAVFRKHEPYVRAVAIVARRRA
ncbi:MAG TPA: methyltransferase domain-containing protein [Polyangiaceae bacterium]|nr:methyltransferase domain-containing protein [Polyangiaceae bacterium]